MPQIIVLSEASADGDEGTVLHRERVNATDFESRHFARQLLERIGWVMADAHTAESRLVGTATR